MRTAWRDERRTRVGASILSAVIFGLFAGRLISEWLRPGLAGALLLTLAVAVVAVALASRRPLAQTWPALLLLTYVVHPDADPRYALAAALMAASTATVWLGDEAGFGRRTSGIRDSPHLRWAVPVLIAAGFLALYVNTLAPGVLPADGGELQLAAAELGVVHPPGFPLYTLLAHLMTRLPLAAGPAYAVNLLSAVIGALTLALVTGAARLLTGSSVAGALAAAAFGLSTTFWAQATTANIRGLTAFFAALALFALGRLWALRVGPQRPQPRRRGLLLLAAALAFGIAHHASLLFMAVVFALFAVATFGAWLRDRKLWAAAAVVGLAALLPLLYLPLRGAAGALNAPEDLATLPGFLNHVLARGFRGDLFYFTEPGELWPRLKVMAEVMAFQFDPLLLAGMVIGAALLLWRRRRLALLLIGSFALHALVTAAYRAPQTVEYMLPAYVPAVLCLAVAMGEGLHGPGAGRLARTLLVGLVVVALFRQWTANRPSFELQRRTQNARDYAQEILQDAPADSLILADWHWATPLWYLQHVEDQRSDLEIRYVFPAADSYSATWAGEIEAALAGGRDVVATHFDEAAYDGLPRPRPLGEAFLYAQQPLEALPAGYEPLALTLGGALEIAGYRVTPQEAAVDQEMIVTVAWRPTGPLPDGASLFAQLASEDGLVAASQDVVAAAQPEGLTLTQLRLTPRPGTPPGSLMVFVGAYASEPLRDAARDARSELVAVPLTASSLPRATGHPTRRPLVDPGADRTLIGYDWDSTIPGRSRLYLHWREGATFPIEVVDAAGPYELPPWYGAWGQVRHGSLSPPGRSRYVPLGHGLVWVGPGFDAPRVVRPGERLELEQEFAAAWPVQRDLVVSVRLVGYEDDGFHWAWWDLADGIPALGAIPTLKWIGGSTVRDPHYLMVPLDATQGQEIEPLVRLYDAFTGRALPVLDDQLAEQAPWIPTGRANVSADR